MSDLHQPSPDLHAIFGIDGSPAGGDPLISVGRGGESELAAHAGASELSLEARPEPGFETFADGDGLQIPAEAGHPVEVKLEPVEEASWEEDAPAEAVPPKASQRNAPEPGWSGITKPSQRGS
jgi:hypothetical protein